MVVSSSVRTCAQNVRELDEFFAVLVADLDPDAVPLGDVIELFSALDVIERRAAVTKVLLARRVEDAGRWKRDGFRSPADQLASLSGSSFTAAKHQLETSKRVAHLPATERALRAGELSVGKVEVIAAAAEVDGSAEAGLLAGAADAPLAQVRQQCLQARGKDRDGAHERIRQARSFKDFVDAEGAWNVMVRGTVDAGEVFRLAHGPIVEEMFKQACAEGRHEPYAAYAFDAFMQLAGRTTNDKSTSDEVTSDEVTSDEVTSDEVTSDLPAETAAVIPAESGCELALTNTKAKAKATSAQRVGIIRVDYAALVRGSVVVGDEVCEIAGLGPVPVAIAREKLGASILKLVITKGVDVVNVTHLGRSATVAQQVALWWQSPGCEVADCTCGYRIENDHHEDWADTHTTRLRKLKRLCEHHHDLKTRHGWALLEGNGPQPMVPPHDPRHPKYRAPPRQDE